MSAVRRLYACLLYTSTLFLGILILYLYQYLTDSAIRIPAILGILILSFFLRADYGPVGLAVIFVFYYFHRRPACKYALFSIFMIFMGNVVQLAAIAAVLPMALYNGRRGLSCKYFFYIFYPGHLAAVSYTHLGVEMDFDYAMSESLAFGGHNAALVVKKYRE